MDKKVKSNKILIVAIIVLVAILAVGGGFAGYLYGSAQKTLETALTAMENGAYASLSAGDEAIEKLQSNPFGSSAVESIRARQIEITAAEVQRLVDADKPDEAEALLNSVELSSSDALSEEIGEKRLALAYAEADHLEASGDEHGALSAFVALGGYADAVARAEAIQARLDYAAAEAIFTGENYEEAIDALRALHTAQGDGKANELEAAYEALLAEQREALRQETMQIAKGRLSAGNWHTAGLGDTPFITGDGRYPNAPAEADAVFSGFSTVYWLKDGRVIGYNDAFGEGERLEAMTDVAAIAAGLNHAVILYTNGRVDGIGSPIYDRIAFDRWNHIKAVAAGAWHSVALQQSGHVEAIGRDDRGQCDTEEWSDVTAIAAGLWHTVGLRNDGTVVATGDNTFGQCDVAEWKDIIAIDCGACTTVGLKTDGTVVFAGDRSAGQDRVEDWTEVAAIAAGAYHTAALRFDGTVLFAGTDTCGQTAYADRLFQSEWVCENACESMVTDNGIATAYTEGEGSELGPWLYCGKDGAAMIVIDETEKKKPFRADLIATTAALPKGHVTNPDAQGPTIRMVPELPEEQARKAKAVVGFTGDYIGFTSNGKGAMIRDGIVYYDRDVISTLAVMPDGTLRIYRTKRITAQELLDMGVKDSFAFGPILVENGVAAFRPEDETGVYTMRVGFGYSDPFHYIVGVAMRDRLQQMTMTELSQLFARYGCRVAYNFDGGHSTSLVFMGKELSMLTMTDVKHYNIRELSDIVVFMTDERVGE